MLAKLKSNLVGALEVALITLAAITSFVLAVMVLAGRAEWLALGLVLAGSFFPGWPTKPTEMCC